MSADSAAAAGAPQTDNEPTQKSESPVPFDAAGAADLMDQLGITSKVKEKYIQEPTEEQTVPETETPEAISLEPDPEPEKEPEIEPEDDDDEEVEDKAKATSPDVAKLQKRNYKLRQRARTAEEKVIELSQKLEKVDNQEPVTVIPTIADPLVHIQTIEDLAKEKERFKLLRNWARSHPDGWTSPDGSESVTPEKVAENLSYAEDVLTENFPQKERELREIRPNSIAQAKAVMPEMLVHGTQEHVAYQRILRQYPVIANHPERETIVAVLLRGWKAIMADQAGAKEKSKDDIPEKILAAAAQRTKTPVLKQTPPGRTTVPAVSLKKRKAELLANVNKAGGDNDSMLSALNEFDRLSAGSNGSREPVPA